MSGDSGLEEKDYVSLKNVKVEFKESNGCFVLCFWIYIENCDSFPSVILDQKHPDITSGAPFLCLNENKKMVLFPLIFLHQQASDPDDSTTQTGVRFVSTETEFPVKKWIHVGCEVLQDLIRLHIDGEIVGEKQLTCSINKDFPEDALKRVYLAFPDENEEIFRGYVHGLDVSFLTSDVKEHYIKDPPMRLSIDHSSASEIEEDGDGVWSIIGGKASCRRFFSLDIVLLDAFGRSVNKELEVFASLLYADNFAPVEHTNDSDPPLFTSCDGNEYASPDKPCKLIDGRSSFKLKISQLSSKCDNRLFRIKFYVPNLGSYPFLETLSTPIRCISRNINHNNNMRSSERKVYNNRIHYINGCDRLDSERVPTIVREAKPSPSSKRIKLGNKEHDSRAWTNNEDNTNGMSLYQRAENLSSGSESSEPTYSDPRGVLGISSPISDLIVFKYCLGGQAERYELLKDIANLASEEQIAIFSKQVSLFSGCSHHRHQIKIAKRLVEGLRAWTKILENNQHVVWEKFVFNINEAFKKIAGCSRSLTSQDFECLRRISGCQDLVFRENFERLWAWLYPVACSLSRSSMNSMWDSLSPVWIEGFITKEEAESTLKFEGGFQEPGTFVLRFPTSRSWPHPDAGNLVVTYVGGDHTIRNRLIAFDFIDSYSSNDNETKPLQDLLLQEPELSRLGRVRRND